jgi:hypothetical protein
VRLLLLLVALGAALAACGSEEPSAYARENTALLERIPAYPGASSPQTSASKTSNTEFAARDWTLPASARAETVIDWYIDRLQRRGWKVTGKSFDTIRATRGNASLSVGVRARTLEAIANSRGA